MSPPHHSCIFPGCHSVQGNNAISLFKFPKDDNVRKRWIDFVKRSYCGEFKITTNTRLCSVHFTPDSYSNCHQVKFGYLQSPLTQKWGWTDPLRPRLASSRPADSRCHHHVQRHYVRSSPSRPQQVGIAATGITCPPESVSVCLCML